MWRQGFGARVLLFVMFLRGSKFLIWVSLCSVMVVGICIKKFVYDKLVKNLKVYEKPREIGSILGVMYGSDLVFTFVGLEALHFGNPFLGFSFT